MANTLRTKKDTKPNQEALNPDKETAINVTEVVKDERTSKILGAYRYYLRFSYLLHLHHTFLLGRMIKTWFNYGVLICFL